MNKGSWGRRQEKYLHGGATGANGQFNETGLLTNVLLWESTTKESPQQLQTESHHINY